MVHLVATPHHLVSPWPARRTSVAERRKAGHDRDMADRQLERLEIHQPGISQGFPGPWLLAACLQPVGCRCGRRFTNREPNVLILVMASGIPMSQFLLLIMVLEWESIKES